MKLKEALGQLNDAKLRKEVWEEVKNFLMGFVDDDIRAASRVIRAPGAGSVPQETIIEIVRGIEKRKIEPLAESITELEGSEVSDGDEDQEQGKRKVQRAVSVRKPGRAN